MKVEAKQEADPFKPFQVIITVESQQEANELFAIHNHAVVTDAMRYVEHSEICNAVSQSVKRLPYEDAHKAIDRCVKAWAPRIAGSRPSRRL